MSGDMNPNDWNYSSNGLSAFAGTHTHTHTFWILLPVTRPCSALALFFFGNRTQLLAVCGTAAGPEGNGQFIISQPRWNHESVIIKHWLQYQQAIMLTISWSSGPHNGLLWIGITYLRDTSMVNQQPGKSVENMDHTLALSWSSNPHNGRWCTPVLARTHSLSCNAWTVLQQLILPCRGAAALTTGSKEPRQASITVPLCTASSTMREFKLLAVLAKRLATRILLRTSHRTQSSKPLIRRTKLIFTTSFQQVALVVEPSSNGISATINSIACISCVFLFDVNIPNHDQILLLR